MAPLPSNACLRRLFNTSSVYFGSVPLCVVIVQAQRILCSAELRRRNVGQCAHGSLRLPLIIHRSIITDNTSQRRASAGQRLCNMLDDNSGATPSTQAPATLVGAAARAGDAAAQPTSGRASPSLPPRRGAAVVAGKRGAGPAPAEASTAPKAMPSLPARAAAVNGSNGAAASELGSGVIDPLEPPSTQRLRAAVHDIRVRLIRAARRLGYQHDCGLVKQARSQRHRCCCSRCLMPFMVP